jgi:hypothetical protein
VKIPDLNTLIPLSEVPKRLPTKRGKRFHISTIYRWATRGTKGRKLKTVVLGGRTYTTEEALRDFMVSSDGVKIENLTKPNVSKIARIESLKKRGF